MAEISLSQRQSALVSESILKACVGEYRRSPNERARAAAEPKWRRVARVAPGRGSVGGGHGGAQRKKPTPSRKQELLAMVVTAS
jgi:hypothetical protein